ncbi:fatty acid desaturase [Sulfuriferula nivalis]|uniref:Fatty acid desaturase domain-containing protein n=1 Tax=Sulfuriferula nivalis TaxID=2675298 RepID=A0A809RF98_9PROT|nr:fatty acid desaturase [Sulfuriferula nivalis]BBP00316.1 hypothetical protein SFSGTM_10240 [Sulfuriferula nivalis]
MQDNLRNIQSAIKEHYYTQRDAATFYLYALLMPPLIYLLLAISVHYDLAWYWIVLLIGPPLGRWAIATHELFHIPGPHPLWVRALPITFSPFNVGWDEYRAEHLGHHKHTANPQDPEWWRIGGGHLRSFLGCLFVSEGAAYHHLKANGWKLNRWWLYRNILFWSIFYLAGWEFIQFWIGLRTAYAIQDWIFNHYLHYQHKEYGTYRVTLPKWLEWISKIIYGKYTIDATLFHDIHHGNANIAVWNLKTVAQKHDAFKLQ